MKKIYLLLVLLMTALIAACGGQDAPTATTTPPTEVPAVEEAEQAPAATEAPPTEAPPTAEPAPEGSYLDTLTHVPVPELVDISWQWLERRDTNGATAITVPNPENYTLTFNADGTFVAQLDCNNGSGSYATTDPGAIFMELGPTTMAACDEESLAVAMANMFGPAQRYRFEDDGQTLVFEWAAGGGSDIFRNPAAAPDAPDEEAIKAIPADAISLSTQGLADSYEWAVVEGNPIPQQGPGGQGFPDHIVVTFDGQTIDDAILNNDKRLYIFPKQAYLDLYAAAGNTTVATQVSRLEELVAGAATRTAPPEGFMPLLPPPPSLMDRWVQFQDLDFGVGTGVRYVSDSPFRPQLGPWTNDATAYYYQGLSNDGQYYVSLIWPVATESLPDTADDVPEEIAAQAADPDTSPAYQSATKESLNALSSADWSPDLSLLDTMVGSLSFPTEEDTAPAEDNLTGTTWGWVSETTPVQVIEVQDTSRYTILFNEDGTANITADCNQVGATYSSDGAGSLSIALGPSTLAACPEDSLADQFLTSLESAAIYFFQDGDLYIDRFADSGTMRFAATTAVPVEPETPDEPVTEPGSATATVTAPDGIFVRSGPGTEFPDIGVAATNDVLPLTGRSADGQWWVVEVPQTWSADQQGWVSAAFVEVSGDTEALPEIEPPENNPALTGATWQWTTLTTPVEQTAVTDPAQYTILFSDDGTAAIKADCNQVGASYTTDGSAISITLGPSTLAACPEGSLDQLFLNSLSSAAITFFQEGDLFIDLFADAGTMRFQAAGSAASPPAAGEPTPVPPADDTSGGAQGILFRVVSFGVPGGEQSVIEGTTITATFSDTAVSGSTGCNDYSATLIPVEDFFTVDSVAVTEQACLEPAGVMEQESAFLAALQATNGFQWAQELVDGTTVITAGQLFYTQADGSSAVINLIAQ